MVENMLLRLPLIAFFAHTPYAFAPPDTETRLIRPPMKSKNSAMWTLSAILIPITVKRTSNTFASETPSTIPLATAMQ